MVFALEKFHQYICGSRVRPQPVGDNNMIIWSGWPDDRTDLPDDIKLYRNIRDALSEAEGIILKDEKIVIPTSLRIDMYTKIHCSQLWHCDMYSGSKKSNILARNVQEHRKTGGIVWRTCMSEVPWIKYQRTTDTRTNTRQTMNLFQWNKNDYYSQLTTPHGIVKFANWKTQLAITTPNPLLPGMKYRDSWEVNGVSHT